MLRRLAEPLLASALLGAVSLSCNSLLDIDEVEFADGSPDASAGGSSVGGAAGAAGGQPTGGSGGTAGSGNSGGTAGTGGTGGAGGAVLGPWGTPQLVTELSDSSADDDDPTFTDDLLELYLNSTRNAATGADIFVSTRASTSGAWGAPQEVAAVNTVDQENNPVIAQNGLTLWFCTDRAGPLDVFVSSRSSRSAVWPAPTSVDGLNSADRECPDAVSADGLTMILHSDRDGGWDLYRSTRPSTSAAWGTPAPITELNTAPSDMQAWLSPDGLDIYFDSGRAGGHADIYRASRPTVSSAFDTPVTVGELNSAEIDCDPWLSPDQRYILFARGVTSRDIYEASR